MKKNRPNIILIILDSARKDFFGCYGNSENLTPNIDALAEKGLMLCNCYAGGCGSSQAHVSIFTGQHSERHKMAHNLCDVKKDLITLPLLLKKLGYKTFGYTKFDIVPPAGHEKLFGFDELVYPEKKEKIVSRKKSMRDKFLQGARRIIKIPPVLKKLINKIFTKIINEHLILRTRANTFDGKTSLDYLFGKLEENKSKGPVFAYTTLLHPHTPYYPPREFLDKIFQDKRIHEGSYDIQLDVHAYANGNFGKAEEAMESVRKCYKADLLYADHLIGNFVEKLKQNSLIENTLLVVMADHGELLGEHGGINHGGALWEELLNIPCVIYYPEKIAPNSLNYNLTSATDIFPTIFDLIGEKKRAQDETVFDGISIFEGGYDWKNRYLVVDCPPVILPKRLKNYRNLMKRANVISRTIRNTSYKYIWQSNGNNCLFKVGSEESPQNNLLMQDKGLEKKFSDDMLRFYKSIEPDFKMDEYPLYLSKETARRITNTVMRNELIKLGYLPA